MIYIYDILLNFNNSRLYEFYEWNKSDDVIHVKKIPLYKVDSKVLDDFFDYNVKIEEKIHLSIFNKTEIFRNKKHDLLSYVTLYTDGFRVMAIAYNKDGLSVSKSKLLLDEEDEILEISSRIEKICIEYKRMNKVHENLFMTRKEEEIRKYLINDLNITYQEKEFSKLKYLYNEYFGKEKEDSNSMYQELLQALLNDVSSKSYDLYDIIKLANQRDNAKI